jgi:hypothetical protein
MQINQYLFEGENDTQMIHLINTSITTTTIHEHCIVPRSGDHAPHCRRVGRDPLAFRSGLRLHACAMGAAAAAPAGPATAETLYRRADHDQRGKRG